MFYPLNYGDGANGNVGHLTFSVHRRKKGAMREHHRNGTLDFRGGHRVQPLRPEIVDLDQANAGAIVYSFQKCRVGTGRKCFHKGRLQLVARREFCRA